MLFIKTTDEKFEDNGFKLVKQDRHGAVYERWEEELKYTHVLAIMFKLNGKHLVQSYTKESCTSQGCDTVGLTYQEMKLALAKMKELGYDK